MLRRGPTCDPNRLKLLLQDNLPKEQQAAMVDHLDGCEQCQEALEGLAADKSWWERLRDIHPSGVLKKPNRGLSESGLGEDLPSDFLAPAEDSSYLGRLGPFAVAAVVGRGGMGVVLNAWDSALNRPA